MDEQTESHGDERTNYGRSDADPAAASLALGSASRDKADAYLDEQMTVARAQTEVLHLQAHELKHELKLRHWSQRVRHVSDVMKLAFEIAVAFIVLTIATAIGFELWDAAHDDGLVIEAFQVPPDMVSRGFTGQVVASQLLDKLSTLQKDTQSGRPAHSYANNWGDDIKVEIPDTGVSIGEFNRYLHAWLGHQSHIDGEVVRTPTGITVTARVSGDGAASFTGPESALDDLLEKTAEQIYHQTQPYRYAVFVQGDVTTADAAKLNQARAVLEELTSNPSPVERAWAWLGLANIARFGGGHMRLASDYFRNALQAVPQFPLATLDMAQNEYFIGHNEAALALGLETSKTLRGSADLTPEAAEVFDLENDVQDDAILGDFAAMAAGSARGMDMPDDQDSREGFRETLLEGLAGEHDSVGMQAAMRTLPPPDPNAQDRVNRQEAVLAADAELADWPKVASDEPGIERAQDAAFPAYDNALFNAVQNRLWFALAEAELGRSDTARRAIATTPGDCYDCVRVRGKIAALAHNAAAAAFWFAEAIKQAPSVPFAYADWGEMLLHEAQYDAAIAKFKAAHDKSPHFADPLEMWGEALMQKNRSDLALAKFEEADKYAPNWGRLHLEWGKALFYAGRKDESKAQIAQAATLELSASEKASLDAWMNTHG